MLGGQQSGVRGRTQVSDPAGVASWGVFLQDAGANKIMVIKIIREHVGCGLAEAKAFVDRAPCAICDWTDPARVEPFKKALIAAGASVG